MKVIELTRGFVAIVDDEDFAELAQYRWRYQTGGYAVRNSKGPDGKTRTIRMHCAIMGRRSGFEIDHRNGNGLDNRRGNLRFATHEQNSWNQAAHKNSKTGIRGVHQIGYKFRARARVGSERIHIGYFETAEEAKAAYNTFILANHGEFARLN